MPNTQEQINLFLTLRWSFVGENSQKLISTENLQQRVYSQFGPRRWGGMSTKVGLIAKT